MPPADHPRGDTDPAAKMMGGEGAATVPAAGCWDMERAAAAGSGGVRLRGGDAGSGRRAPAWVPYDLPGLRWLARRRWVPPPAALRWVFPGSNAGRVTAATAATHRRWSLLSAPSPPAVAALRDGRAQQRRSRQGPSLGAAAADRRRHGTAAALDAPLLQAVWLLELHADVREGWHPATATAAAAAATAAAVADKHESRGAAKVSTAKLQTALETLVVDAATPVAGEGAAATRRAAARLNRELLLGATVSAVTTTPKLADHRLDLSPLPPLAASLQLYPSGVIPLWTAAAVHLLARVPIIAVGKPGRETPIVSAGPAVTVAPAVGAAPAVAVAPAVAATGSETTAA
ncbi:hypothetical protein MMPV_006203 [Pyropia vietnamensis]